MQYLDPDLPHGLNDLIDRMHTEPSWKPSWADVCRVRDFVGAQWSRAHGNVYDFASNVLYHLADADKARATVTPYVTVACPLHKAAIGVPCGARMFDRDIMQAHAAPVICGWRVLAKHDRLAALEFLEPVSPVPASSKGRDIIPISAETLSVVATVRVQYCNPQLLVPDRIVVSSAGDWVIHDICIGGKSIFAPHLDLPGALFGIDVMGPLPRLPVIEQDQWIEVEAHCIRNNHLGFIAAIVGNTRQEKETLNSTADTI